MEGGSGREAVKLLRLSTLPPHLKNPRQAHRGPWITGEGIKLGHDGVDFLVAGQPGTDHCFPNMFHRHRSDLFARPLPIRRLDHFQIDICQSCIKEHSQ